MPTYRFLHQPTVIQWLETYHQQAESASGGVSLLPARQAIVLMCLATASMYNNGSSLDAAGGKREPFIDSEPFFNAAQARLSTETGKVRLESVQARLAICLYLLHTSRPNQSWYTFGITVQLLMALGLHRDRMKSSSQQDLVAVECSKRAFWAAFTLDTYLSVILGRPHLIHSDDIDQRFPEHIDDEEFGSTGITSTLHQKDRVIQASIYHAKLTAIVKTALKEQYSVQRRKDQHKINTATRLTSETESWKASLPVLLSGAVHPSSLIQIFQRQIVVLDLAYTHAMMLINRPLLLMETSVDNKPHIINCLSAAKSTLDTILGFASDRRVFPIMWHSQFLAFNALSITYVWLIQRKRGRLSGIRLQHPDQELFHLAEKTQNYFAEATKANAPSLRYSIILDELQQETRRLMSHHVTHRPLKLEEMLDAPVEGHPFTTPAHMSETSPSVQTSGSIGGWESTDNDFPLDPDLWLQLDSFPFSDIEFEAFA